MDQAETPQSDVDCLVQELNNIEADLAQLKTGMADLVTTVGAVHLDNDKIARLVGEYVARDLSKTRATIEAGFEDVDKRLAWRLPQEPRPRWQFVAAAAVIAIVGWGAIQGIFMLDGSLLPEGACWTINGQPGPGVRSQDGRSQWSSCIFDIEAHHNRGKISK